VPDEAATSTVRLGEPEIPEFVVHLSDEKKASPETVKMHVAALRLLYSVTLKRPKKVASLVWPKVPHPCRTS
jgi:hypothetical protein